MPRVWTAEQKAAQSRPHQGMAALEAARPARARRPARRRRAITPAHTACRSAGYRELCAALREQKAFMKRAFAQMRLAQTHSVESTRPTFFQEHGRCIVSTVRNRAFRRSLCPPSGPTELAGETFHYITPIRVFMRRRSCQNPNVYIAIIVIQFPDNSFTRGVGTNFINGRDTAQALNNLIDHVNLQIWDYGQNSIIRQIECQHAYAI